MLAPSQSLGVTLLRGLAGAAIGAAIGYFVFFWGVSEGFYVMALPGSLVGLGCGLATGKQSRPAGIMAAVIAAALCLLLEWKSFPFVADESFSYFLTHLHQKAPIKLLMIVLGVAFGFWFGQGRGKPVGGGATE